MRRGGPNIALLFFVGALGVGCDDAGSRTDADARPAPPFDATGSDTAAPDAAPAPDAARPRDAGPTDARVAPDAAPDVGPPHGARPPRAPAGTLPAPRGWRFARGLIHLHSVHSHDACDGEPKPGGVPDAECLRRLRAALCDLRLDYALLTDHPATVTEVDRVEALLIEPGDRPVERDGLTLANRLPCPDGHEVLIAAGAEGDLMPTMLQAEVDGPFRDASPEGVRALTEAGGLVFQAHVERFEPEDIEPLGLHGIEIYNLHANLAPDGELRQFAEVLPLLLELVRAGASGPHPDLTQLAVFRENHQALKVWDAITPRARLVGIAGSDIHENLPPVIRPTDGDRIDSYRRLGGWFANYLLVEQTDYDGLRAALEAGRLFVVFDQLGPPGGFDVHAVMPDGEVLEMGAEAPFAEGARLVVRPPQVPAGAAIEVRLVRATEAGAEVVRTETGAFEHSLEGAGAWRVEVWITPGHLRPELGDFADRLLRPQVWIYANPVYLR